MAASTSTGKKVQAGKQPEPNTPVLTVSQSSSDSSSQKSVTQDAVARVTTGNNFLVQYLGWMASDGLFGAEFVTPILNRTAWINEEHLQLIPHLPLTVSNNSVTVTRCEENALSAADATMIAAQRGAKVDAANGTAGSGNVANYKQIVIASESIAYVQRGEARLTDCIALVLLGYSEETKRIAHVHVYKCRSEQQATTLCNLIHSMTDTTEHLQHVRSVEKDAYKKALVTKCSDALFQELHNRSEPDSVVVDEQVVRKSGLLNEELQSRLSDSRCALLLPPRDYDEDQRRRGDPTLAIKNPELAERRSNSRSLVGSTNDMSDVQRSSLHPPKAPTHVRTRSVESAAIASNQLELPPRDYDDEALDGVYGQVTLRKPLPSGTWAQHVSVQRDLATVRQGQQPTRALETSADNATMREMAKRYSNK